jgi:hypothetical protein
VIYFLIILRCELPSLDSNILVNLEREFIKLCEFKWNQEFKLLYRGSLHGFRASDFHAKCDNIPKTVTVIRAASSGNIFGGYTKATWDRNNTFKSDPSAFIFSLVNKENKPVKVKVALEKSDKAIVCLQSFGPRFGKDIVIGDSDSAVYQTNISNFGHTYVLPNYPLRSNQADNFLAGSRIFSVDEIEVFELK